MSMYALGGPLQRVSSYFSLPSLHGDRQPESFLIEFASHRLIVRWNWVTTKASSVCFAVVWFVLFVWFGLVWFGLVWFGLFWFGFDLFCFVLFCFVLFCLFVLGWWVSTHQRKTNSDPNPRRLQGVTIRWRVPPVGNLWEFRVCDAIVVHQIPTRVFRNIMEKIQSFCHSTFWMLFCDVKKKSQQLRLDAVFLPKPADDSFFSLESRKTPWNPPLFREIPHRR